MELKSWVLASIILSPIPHPLNKWAAVACPHSKRFRSAGTRSQHRQISRVRTFRPPILHSLRLWILETANTNSERLDTRVRTTTTEVYTKDPSTIAIHKETFMEVWTILSCPLHLGPSCQSTSRHRQMMDNWWHSPKTKVSNSKSLKITRHSAICQTMECTQISNYFTVNSSYNILTIHIRITSLIGREATASARPPLKVAITTNHSKTTT